jgi:SAM-dependent methyltransferase
LSSYDVFARFYDLDTEESTADIPFWISLARRTGGPVLEVGCGTGRVLVPLAQAGFSVVGIDLSPAMLEVAQTKVQTAGVGQRVELIQADALSLNLGRRFPLALVALNSFGHFVESGEPEQALDRIAAHLTADGILALDLTNPVPGAFGETTGAVLHDYTRPGPTPGWQTIKLRSQALDPVEQIIDVSCFYDEVGPGGELRRTVASFLLRYFYKNELGLLFERAGLILDVLYGGYELEDLTEASDRLIAIGRKRGN